jgi:hypothetical protein
VNERQIKSYWVTTGPEEKNSRKMIGEDELDCEEAMAASVRKKYNTTITHSFSQP